MNSKQVRVFFSVILTLFLASCSYYIPKRHVLENSATFAMPEENSFSSRARATHLDTKDALDPTSFEILSWNILAGCRSPFKNATGRVFGCNSEKWEKTFSQLAKNKDIILIQEAYPDHEMLESIERLGRGYEWNMTTAFIADEKRDIPTGVMTIARYTSRKAQALRKREPFLPTPKSALITEYDLRNDASHEPSAQTLMVVNVHAILMGKERRQAQLEEIRRVFDHHEGPVIVAGDFNTASPESKDFLINNFAEGFEQVEFNDDFNDDNRTRSLSGFPIDYVFYRGLSVKTREVVDLKKEPYQKVSDHNPIVVEFSVSMPLE